MSDRIKVNFAQLNQTINEINDAVRSLNEESAKIADIKKKMANNWTGAEALKAYEVIGVENQGGMTSETILASIASMVEIQTEVRDLLQQKYSGFEEVQF